MFQSAPPPTLASERKRIARMVEAEGPFLEIERALAHTPLPPDQKIELWTMAWSRLGTRRQAQQVRWITGPL